MSSQRILSETVVMVRSACLANVSNLLRFSTYNHGQNVVDFSNFISTILFVVHDSVRCIHFLCSVQRRKEKTPIKLVVRYSFLCLDYGCNRPKNHHTSSISLTFIIRFFLNFTLQDNSLKAS